MGGMKIPKAIKPPMKMPTPKLSPALASRIRAKVNKVMGK